MKCFMFRLLVMLISVISSASLLRAVTFEAPLNSSDTIIGEIEAGSPLPVGYYPDLPLGLVGSSGNNGERTSRVPVFGFTLPEDVFQIDSATFTVTNINQDRGTTALDLWGLDTTDPNSSGASFFLESNTDSNPGNVKLANDFFTTDTPTNTTVTLDVTAYIASLYAGTAPLPGQSEVFFRINQDRNINLPTLQRIGIDVNTISLDIEFTAFSSIPPVPEPSTAWLLGAGLIGLMRIRTERRRRKANS